MSARAGRDARFTQLVDGVGVEMTSNEMFRFACCDCGLVHDMVIATTRKVPFGLAVRRNKRATSARRRRLAQKRATVMALKI